MFGAGAATKIYVAPGATDMRKGFEGRHGIVHDQLGCDPMSGHLFLFTNARRTRLKVMVWDGSGLWVCAKRLEKGRFRWPEATSADRVSMSHDELTLLLNGIDLSTGGAGASALREGGQGAAADGAVDHAADVLRAAVVQPIGSRGGGGAVRVRGGSWASILAWRLRRMRQRSCGSVICWRSTIWTG